MQKLTYTNSLGQSIVWKDYVVGSSEYKLQKYDLEPVENEGIISKGFQQDGVTFKYSEANPRLISITGLVECNGFADAFEKEETLKTILNPFLDEGTLKYENDFIEREITVRVTGQPIIPNFKNLNNNVFSVIMQADYPLFSDLEYTELPLVGISGGLEFDSPSFSFETGTSFTLGDISASSGILSNNGHVPAPLLIEWTGVATDPKITLEDTGEFILLNRTLTSDERLIITTGYGNKTAYIETISTGAIDEEPNIIDDTSTFFSAPIGNSTVSFTATSGGSTSIVVIKYKQLWQ